MGDSKKNKVKVEPNNGVIDIIDLNDYSEEEGTPLRPILCLKNKCNLKEFEDKEDCFILDFDPNFSPIHISKLSFSNADDSNDISVLAEKGQVACRDFPHSRHCCARYPFGTTEHESYCQLCYCFVCDVSAPCKDWRGCNGHCHAINNDAWKLQRKAKKELHKTV